MAPLQRAPNHSSALRTSPSNNAASNSHGSRAAGLGNAPAPVVAPVVVNANDLQGSTVTVPINSMLVINTESLPVDSYTAEVADPTIAVWVQGRDDGSATFTAALRALREFPRVPVTFEAAVGEPGAVLVEHTTDADILVLAAGLPEDVAAYCRRHASCDILTVRPAPIARTA